jgi:hypothetical protein
MLNLLKRFVGNTPAVPAVLVGLGVGMAVNMGLIQLNSTVLYPAPEGMDMNDPEQLQAYMDTLPAAAFLVVMAAHLGQALIGGWLAACLAVKRPVLLALIVGAFTMVGGIMMMTMVTGPAWMMVELPLYLLLPYLAGRSVARSRGGT